MVHVKICGVRTASDAVACARLGASAIGVNFVAASPRRVDVATARAIARAIHAGTNASTGGSAGGGSRAPIVVGVVADMTLDAMRDLVRDAELDCLQLHGGEPPATLTALLPHAYKAVRVATAADVGLARTYPGEYMLVDAKVDGALGGTGHTFDWSLVRELATERRLTLAGGLGPDNVAQAIRAVRPWCVDVASGVERAPGDKDLERVRAFVEAVRAA
jgi:phosphoribosylanthranilate isomerase